MTFGHGRLTSFRLRNPNARLRVCMALTECLQVSWDINWTYARNCRYPVGEAEMCTEAAIFY
jgi:hypothetical protein